MNCDLPNTGISMDRLRHIGSVFSTEPQDFNMHNCKGGAAYGGGAEIVFFTVKHKFYMCTYMYHTFQLTLFLLEYPSLFFLLSSTSTIDLVLAFVCHLLVTNFVKFKQKYGKSSKIVSFIKQINFFRLAGMMYQKLISEECNKGL